MLDLIFHPSRLVILNHSNCIIIISIKLTPEMWAASSDFNALSVAFYVAINSVDLYCYKLTCMFCFYRFCVPTKLITECYWNAHIYTASHEIPRLLWKPNVRYRKHKSISLDLLWITETSLSPKNFPRSITDILLPPPSNLNPLSISIEVV